MNGATGNEFRIIQQLSQRDHPTVLSGPTTQEVMDAWVGSYHTIHTIRPPFIGTYLVSGLLERIGWIAAPPLPTSRPHLYYVGNWRLSYVRRNIKYDHDEMLVQTLARNFKKLQTDDDRWIVVETFGFIKFLASVCTNHISSGVLLTTQAFTV